MGKGPVCHPKDVEIEHHDGPDSGSPSRQVTIWTLPDDALLEIFSFFANDSKSFHWWHTLVHVCRRWRSIVFASPRHLNLRLFCTQKVPVRKSLDVWPAFPIVISYSPWEKVVVGGMDNLIAALERKDRVHEINLAGVSRFMAEMQEPFPELSRLDLSSWNDEESSPSLPESLLGGSAPRLREFCLYGIRFPALREFLLSASGLVKLYSQILITFHQRTWFFPCPL
ncbi:hypothetical protein BC826DRAFT_422383 [Russula brevipes]|nr:hypothetical protein BC826DRAFT_422383 [Russula brevipes]